MTEEKLAKRLERAAKYCEARNGVVKGCIAIQCTYTNDPTPGAVRIPGKVAAELIEAGYIMTAKGEPYGDPELYADGDMAGAWAAISETMVSAGLQAPNPQR